MNGDGKSLKEKDTVDWILSKPGSTGAIVKDDGKSLIEKDTVDGETSSSFNGTRLNLKGSSMDDHIVLVHARSSENIEGYGMFAVGVFYIVDLRTGIVNKCLGVPNLLGDDSSTRMIVLGSSSLYIAGGDDCQDYPYGVPVPPENMQRHFKFSCFNIIHNNPPSPNTSWISMPPFTSPGFHVNCVAYNGKIYLFGKCAIKQPFGEVFDPTSTSDKWTVLSPPPGHKKNFSVSSPSLSDPENNRIIVHLTGMNTLYAYHPDDDRWECLVKEFGSWLPLITLVDGVLYYYISRRRNPFIAFDLSSKKWLKVTVPPPTNFDTHMFTSEFDSLFHFRDGTICVASWSLDLDDLSKTHLIFVKFKTKRTSPDEALVTPLNCDIIGVVSEHGIGANTFVPL